MKKLTGNEIIKMYIEFFEKKGHKHLESSSLIPYDDPSVLWVNAGVTPLKKYFDGSMMPPSKRIVTCQKCIRTGDIEEVGKTARHHTFFQMLGNFSIGDYFKEEALEMAWELLTSKEYFDFDKNKLYITVYPDDIDAYNKWISLGVDASHIIKLADNFWEIGPGPSGPDSEVFYDRGSKYDKNNYGIKLLENDIENDRYIEIWNNVFSQYNAKEGVDRKDYEELPSKNIDTGMGVERMACIMQGVETNYETDLFMPLMNKITEICHIDYIGQMEFKVIADHTRSLVFALSDGASISNYGRGYVLRRLLRRAVRMGKKLGINHSFISEVAKVVEECYKEIYPNLSSNISDVCNIIDKEEELFHKTLLSGEKRLEQLMKESEDKKISGSEVFKLYDTYGFPCELTKEIAEESGFVVDLEEFRKYMHMQKELARENRKVVKSMNIQNELLLNYKEESKFVGYDTLENKTKILAIIRDNEFVDSSTKECYIVLEECPFYAESGGQVSDGGFLKNPDCKLEVLDVIKSPNNQHLVYVTVLEGIIKKGDYILTHVSLEKRNSIAANHSAVHILHKVLRDTLGDKALQAGSKVDEKGFRFDFNYHGRLSDELIVKIEDEVNNIIKKAKDTSVIEMNLEDAKKMGAIALFNDKYKDIVRVVTIDESIELCGGTHVKNTKDIDRFAIISVENKGSDTYRIIASTGNSIEDRLEDAIKPGNMEMIKLLGKVKNIINDGINYGIKLEFNYDINNDIPHSYKDIVLNNNELEGLKKQVKEFEKEYNDLKVKSASSNIDKYIDNKEVINGINTIIVKEENIEVGILNELVSNIVNKLDNCFVLIASINNGSVNYIAKSNNQSINCGNIVKELSLKSDGNGGGNATFARGGGSNITNIDNLLDEVKKSIN